MLWNKGVSSSMCFPSPAAGSRMKGDVDFNLLCIKPTKQDLCISKSGKGTEWELLSAEARGLHLSNNWFIGSFWWWLPRRGAAAQPPPAEGSLGWALLPQPQLPRTSEGSFNSTSQAQDGGLHLVLITLDYREVLVCISLCVKATAPMHCIVTPQAPSWRVSWHFCLPQVLLESTTTQLVLYLPGSPWNMPSFYLPGT